MQITASDFLWIKYLFSPTPQSYAFENNVCMKSCSNYNRKLLLEFMRYHKNNIKRPNFITFSMGHLVSIWKRASFPIGKVVQRCEFIRPIRKMLFVGQVCFSNGEIKMADFIRGNPAATNHIALNILAHAFVGQKA